MSEASQSRSRFGIEQKESEPTRGQVMKIFWSWQSDSPGKIGRFLIRDALREAIEELKQSPEIEEPSARELREQLHLDQDREGVPGIPDLARTIFDKIDLSDVVVADVTAVGATETQDESASATIPSKKLINSNVAIELGYALHSRTDRNILMVFNVHYGRHEDLPFDLRHKGGAITFDLTPSADKERIDQEKKKLRKAFIGALRPYLQVKAKSEPPFVETAPTFNNAAYFGRRQPIAEVGEMNVDQVSFIYDTDSFCYLRLIPTARPPAPIPLATLNSIAGPCPLLAQQIGGGLVSRNEYGIVVIQPRENLPSGTAGLAASTQLFQNGEIWAINGVLMIGERGHRPAWVRIPSLPTLVFERAYFRALNGLVDFMRHRLSIQLPISVELGMVGMKGLYLALSQAEQWGPIRKEHVIRRTVIQSTDQSVLSLPLLEFFAEVYDATGYARPQGLYGFPPNEPNG